MRKKKVGKGIQMVLGGETYLDDIESREHAPMGLAALGNCSDGGCPRMHRGGPTSIQGYSTEYLLFW